jgi:hypothetical protein
MEDVRRFRDQFYANIVNLCMPVVTVVDLTLKATGVKRVSWWQAFLMQMAHSGFIQPSNTILHHVKHWSAIMHWMLYLCIKDNLNPDSWQFDGDIVSMILHSEWWSKLLIGMTILTYSSTVLCVCRNLLFWYCFLQVFVMLLPLTICCMELTEVDIFLIKIPHPYRILSLWASNEHKECLEKWNTSSMSSLAIMASFKPDWNIAAPMFSVIVLLQLFLLCVSTNSDGTHNTSAAAIIQTAPLQAAPEPAPNTPNTTTLPYKRQTIAQAIFSTLKAVRDQMIEDIKTLAWMICRVVCKQIYHYRTLIRNKLLQLWAEDFRELVFLILRLLQAVFHDMCLQVLTLGVHARLDSTLVALYMCMLLLISCLQAHLETPDQVFLQKLWVAVFDKILCPRMFCPIASTAFMKPPKTVELGRTLGCPLLNDEASRNVLVCAGMLPGNCTDTTAVHTWFLWTINICVFLSFMRHVGGKMSDSAQNRKIQFCENMYMFMLGADRLVKHLFA